MLIEERQAQIDALLERYFPEKDSSVPQESAVQPVNLDDDALLQKAFEARNGDRIQRLLSGDWSDHPSHSEADLALCSHLAFWTGRDAERVDRLFRASGLFRPKWEEYHGKETYGQMTIQRAIEVTTETYQEPRPTSVSNGTNPARELAGQGYGSSGTQAEDDWPERSPLPSDRPAVPTLPEEMVPRALRAWLTDTASRACMTLECVVCPALIGIGSLVGRSVGIRPARYDDYLVVPNLWGALIARPGAMKTFAIQEGIKPLTRLETNERERYEVGHDVHEAEKERITAEVNAIKGEMGKTAKDSRGTSATSETPTVEHPETKMAELEVELAAKLQESRDSVHTPKRYMTQDATVEKLGELLNENPRGLLMVRDELAGWLKTLDKPERGGDREFYLEGWNGTGGYTFDRIGRGTVSVAALTISIYGGIQPGKLIAYIRGAIDGNEGADGLLQRLQLTVFPDGLGEWVMPESWPDIDAKNRAFEILQYLDALDPNAIGAKQDEFAGGSIPFLRFTTDAQLVYDLWRDELENRLRSEEFARTPAFEAHMAKYRSLMPSLALLFHLIDVADGGPPGPVAELPTRMATAWCEFLEAHARKIYAEELYPGVGVAHALATKITKGVIKDGQSVRDIYQHHWTGLTNQSQVNASLEVLITCGWVRIEILETGGRPTERLRLHPDLKGKLNE